MTGYAEEWTSHVRCVPPGVSVIEVLFCGGLSAVDANVTR